MQVYRGRAASEGIAVGKIKIKKRQGAEISCRRAQDTGRERERYQRAREAAAGQLELLWEEACRKAGEEEAAIFLVHRMILEGEEYGSLVEQRLQEGFTAEYAVAATRDGLAERFLAAEEESLRERSADVVDLSERVLELLRELPEKQRPESAPEDMQFSEPVTAAPEDMQFSEPVILVAEDMLPSETVRLDRDKVLAFVTVRGSVNSHAAILARSMGIPAVTGCSIRPEELQEGSLAVADGFTGTVYVEPEPELLKEMLDRQQKKLEEKALLEQERGKENVSLDGRRIRLRANVGSLRELKEALADEADGIGLFRSEFLYLEREELPKEEELFAVYRAAVEAMDGRELIIRTLDVGADKSCGCLELEKEENPALGLRAIRLCFARPEIFRTQLRALLRASAFGQLSVMYPMITGVEEVTRILNLVEEIKAELNRQGTACGNPRQGIMIETPAAVMLSGELAEKVDFFSIGTNDLTQYTLAADRQNPRMGEFYRTCHPAVLKMIELVVDNAHAAGIPVGICGELGADRSLTEKFLVLGVDELSVAPGSILAIRKAVRGSRVSE